MGKQKFKMPIPGQNIPTTTEQKEESVLPPSPPLTLSPKEIEHPIELKFIPRSKIVFHERNDYEQSDIEDLAESILTFGLIHTMEARYDEDKDVYIIESGERRTRAIDLLLKKYLNSEEQDTPDYKNFLRHVKGFANGYPLNIFRTEVTDNGELSELDQIDSVLRLEEANLQVRNIDQLTKAKQIQRRKELLQRRNELLPKANKVNILDELAEKSNMSRRTVMKYTAIAEKLIPELQEEFKKSNISLNDGSRYAQLSEEEQKIILQLIQRGEKASKAEIEQLKTLVEKQKIEKESISAELTQLIKAKQEAEKMLEETLSKKDEERAEIEAKIRESLSTEQDIHKAERAALSKSLEESQSEIERIKKSATEQSHIKDEEIKKLRLKLAELEKQPELSTEEKRVIHLTTQCESSISNLQIALENTLKICAELEKLDPEKGERYKSIIINLLNMKEK